MASFTDAISQFNPYVAQLPVEAMKEVGMYKQAKYEEGVQKIQGEIDKIAGLDVARGIDQQYLQSRMNELGNRLKTVAAGDFSNFQLVNSVGGMTKQLARDKNIQNAVSSTAKYRKALTEMEAARKEGKSSPSNEYVFNMAANEWLNSNDVNKGFSGGYKPYTNWKKEAVEVLKALTKDSTITENMFTADGRLADYVVKNKFAGISPEKIQEALLTGLTPAAMEQMQIDGIYSYANKTPDEFKATVYNDFKERTDYFLRQKNVLENAKLDTSSGAEIQKLNQQISAIDKMINNVSSQYAGLAESLEKGNVDGAKANLFTVNQLTNFAKAFSFTETEETYGQSYAAEMAFKRETAEKDWLKFTMDYNQKERFKKIDIRLKEKEIDAMQGMMYGGLPTSVPQDELPKVTLGQVIDNVNKTKTSLNNSDLAFVQRNSVDPNKVPTEAEKNTWIEAQRNKWLQGKADPKVAQYFNQTEGMRKQIEDDQLMVLSVQNDAKNRKYVIDGKEVSGADLSTLIPAGTKGISFKTTTGTTLNFTPQEIAEFNAKRGKYIKSSGGGPGGKPAITVDYEGARKDLSDKEYTLFRIYEKTSGRTPADEMISNKIKEIGGKVNPSYDKLINAQDDYIANEVTKRVTSMQGVTYDFSVGKPAEKAALAGALNRFADFADQQKGKIAGSPGFSSGDLRKVTGDLTSANMKVVEGTTYAPAMYEISATGKDGVTTKFKVTPQQKAAMFGDLFEAAPEVRAFRPIQETINKRGWGSTSTTSGRTTWANAALNRTNIPNVKSFGVNGNVDEAGTAPDGTPLYSIRLNIRDPRTGEITEDIPWPKNSLATESEVLKYMAAVNDITAFELLYDRAPTAAELKQIQKAQNKPF